MQELVTGEEPKNWLQLYVDAVTEKDPYKRLALVRRLREVPRHDESDESPERPRLQLLPKAPAPRQASASTSTKPLQVSPSAAPKKTAPKPAHLHQKERSRKLKVSLRSSRRSPRLRNA